MSGQQTQNHIDFESWLSGEGALLLHGDSLEVLRRMPDNSVHAVVTDPPYGLGQTTPEQVAECVSAWARGESWKPKGRGFMGKEWDAWVPAPDLWREVLRVLMPGGHALVFAGSRTQDLMSLSLRLSGFELRDTMMWLYGSGFPKSHSVDKAIDKHLGVFDQREVVGSQKLTGTARKQAGGKSHGCKMVAVEIERVDTEIELTAAYSEEAKSLEGWGTALKPAYEPILIARKPLEGTIAENAIAYSTGGININGCRVGWGEGEEPYRHQAAPSSGVAFNSYKSIMKAGNATGRWPANVLIDGGVGEMLDEQSRDLPARFFYCSKASVRERDAGVGGGRKRANTHPTVKPLDLMCYLVRLVTPKGAIVLDPFMGSGTTGCAAAIEGARFVGIEREGEYITIAQERVKHWTPQPSQPEQTAVKATKAGSDDGDPEQLSLF